ncbi:protein THEM6-like [Pecten maximus]|uniref:protein THEM6-like n=1 Tax=Pecten maximus TaxID=6579 RepID=UPI001457FC15|nr:protein THEM6-like [Pecten maximus]
MHRNDKSRRLIVNLQGNDKPRGLIVNQQSNDKPRGRRVDQQSNDKSRGRTVYQQGNDKSRGRIVLTTDLDAMFHMNNSRYLRECDLAQTKLWLESHVVKTIGQRFHVTNAATNIRFRRSLELFTRYQIVSRFIHWDEKAFYIEQQFVRLSDGFVCAVNICKQATIGCTPASMVQRVDEHLTSPPVTEELRKLMTSWKLSSERLRKSS